ncbi:hypothetical protein [Paenibacillus polymyxa]|uniref:hypothetical protein n=1 Tax=Paenibacillus polymyxa TaxID=1406 RepID=UPI0003D39263|nr:hypothetical protein [Paenibacillus polymyxa]
MKLYIDGSIEGTPQEIAEYKGLGARRSIAIKGVDFKINKACEALSSLIFGVDGVRLIG